MDAASLLDLTRRFVVRAFTADFQREKAADDERTQLAAQTPPIANALAQDYVAWRRAVLWVSGILLAISVGIALADHQSTAEQFIGAEVKVGGQAMGAAEIAQQVRGIEEKFGKDNLAIIDGLQDFLLFVKLGVAVLVVLAAQRWLRVRGSRSLARWAWLAALVLPLLVAAWPWTQSLDFSHLDQVDQMGNLQQVGSVVKAQIGFALAASLMLTVGPKLIALFPGIIRSSLILKTLLPEAAAPGWLTVVFAPFFAGFLLLVLCLVSQLQGSWVLMAGIVLLVLGALLYVKRAADLVRPHTAEEVRTVIGGIRHTVGVMQGIGIALLVYYVFTIHGLPWHTVIHLLLEALGGLLLTMVAISDITLALLAFSQRQGADFQGSQMRQAYEERLQAMAGAGLTDVEGALGVKDLDRLRRPGQA